jgi:hypothetical protein
MRLKLLVPSVEPSGFEEPSVCPYAKCGGKHFHLRQEVHKPVRDTVYTEVTARRYDCLRCGRTFRVYPLGISDDQTSRRLKGLAVLFYIMGLSYGAVALVLTALGHPLGKTAVYEAVQAAGEKVTGLRRADVQVSTARLLVAALGADLTSVKCKGEWLTVGVTTDALAGTTLTIDTPGACTTVKPTPFRPGFRRSRRRCRRKFWSPTMPMASRPRRTRTG